MVTISIETVRRILHERGVTWQASKTWKASNDPDFTTKIRRILGLYDHPPAGAGLSLALRTPEEDRRCYGFRLIDQWYRAHLHTEPFHPEWGGFSTWCRTRMACTIGVARWRLNGVRMLPRAPW